MLKPLCLSLALVALGATTLGADEASPNISTWRWRVSALVEPQSHDTTRVAMGGFDQRYERYSTSGAPEAARGESAK